MKLLSMDTSTKVLSLAVSDIDKILAYHNTRLEKVLSSSIIPSIKMILKKANVSINDIDAFVVGLGPGSFTSLRVGLSTIKAFAVATGKPVVGIPSLDILAGNIQKERSHICVICDAKRHLVYSCRYQKTGKNLKKVSAYVLTDIENVLSKINKDTVFIGDGIKLFQEDIEKWHRSKTFTIKFEDETKWYPRAQKCVRLALERLKDNQIDNIDQLKPMYLYPKDCQVRK